MRKNKYNYTVENDVRLRPSLQVRNYSKRLSQANSCSFCFLFQIHLMFEMRYPQFDSLSLAYVLLPFQMINVHIVSSR